MAAILKTTFFPILVPLALSITTLKVSSLRSKTTDLFELPLEDKGFIDFVKSKQSWTQFGLLFLIFFLLMQLFVLPIFPHSMGKLTRITPVQVPRLAFTFLLFGLVPIQISQLICEMLGGDDMQAQLRFRPFGYIIGFFMVTFLLQVVTPLDIILSVILFSIFKSKSMFDKIFKSFSVTTQTLSTTSKANRAMILLLFVFLLTVTTFRYIPGYTKLAEIVNSKIGFFGESAKGFGNHMINIGALLLLPLVIAKSLESTTQKMGTMKEGQGYTTGYFIGVLVGLLLLNFSGRTIKLELTNREM